MNAEVKLIEQEGDNTAPIIIKTDQPVFVDAGFWIASLLLCGWVYKNFVADRVDKYKHSLMYSIRREKLILGILYKVLANNKADRVVLLVAHNGKNYAPDNSFWKVSCLAEATNAGTAYTFDDLQDIPISKVKNALVDVIRDGFIDWVEGDEFKDEFTKILYMKNGVKASRTIILKSNDEPIAFLAISYRDSADFEHLNLKELANDVFELEALLIDKKENIFTKSLSFLQGRMNL